MNRGFLSQRRNRVSVLTLFRFVFPLMLGACASTEKPVRDMIFASSALKAAERAQAEKRSPDLYRRAENSFWKAKRYYLAKEYREATKAANDARRLAENAELDADIKESTSVE